LHAVITPKEKQLIEKIPTENLEAYEAYLKGMFYWEKITQNDLETALKYFELAKEKDPEYAPAYCGISLVWMGLVQAGFVSPEDAGSHIAEPLVKALELDSTHAEVHYTLALMNTWVMWDWAGGEKSFKRTFAFNPNHAEAHAYYSHFLLLAGRSEDEAMEQIQIALKLDPLNPLIKSLYGVVLSICSRYDEAIQAFNEALKIEPGFLLAVGSIIEPLFITGRLQEALEMEKLYYQTMCIQKAVDAIDKGMASGNYKRASLYLAEALEEQYQDNYFLAFEIAYRFVQCGDKEKALHWLEVGFETRDQSMPYLLCYPFIKDLREEPRFQEIARNMSLPYK
jgi:adenylate cyclase